MARIFFFLCFLVSGMVAAQTPQPSDTIAEGVRTNDLIIASQAVQEAYDANRPARAAFYSAVIPGLGQAYNKKYWKIPIAYAALGGAVYAYIANDQEYDRLREAFQIRLQGRFDDEFSRDGSPIISTDGLERAQRTSQRNKELSILIAAAIYAVQIIDANVDGHLSQFNVDRDLSFKPYIDYNISAVGTAYGFSLSYSF